MIPKSDRFVHVPTRRAFAALVALSLMLAGGMSLAGASTPKDEVPYALRQKLAGSVGAWIAKQREVKNDDGNSLKKGVSSRKFTKVDDSTYLATAHVNTAEATEQVTERFQLTLSKSGNKWEVSNEQLKDTYVGLVRPSGGKCYPYDSFAFDKEGLKMSSGKGHVCELYQEGKVREFMLRGKGMKYTYEPPPHVNLIQTSHDFYALHKMLTRDHSREMVFEPYVFHIDCDGETCEELLTESFKGLTRVAPDPRPTGPPEIPAGAAEWAHKYYDRWTKERKEDVFAHFTRPVQRGNRFFNAAVLKELDVLKRFGLTLPGSGIALASSNWGGWEVQLYAFPRRADLPETLNGPVFGYFSEETVKSTDAYTLERRDDEQARWYEVYSVKGDVIFNEDDVEMLHGDIEYGITLKRDLRDLPFFIATARQSIDQPPKFSLNSIMMDGEELTWVKTGATSGLVVLPEEMEAGTRVNLTVDFDVRAIIKRNHAFLQMNRFGWMPFVRFGDFIDEFEMTIHSPAKYKVLGIGEKMEEKREGDVLISRWSAENPVVFPTIILGKYESATPSKEAQARKADGTLIPVEVHVDEVSMGQLNIDVQTVDQAVDNIEAITSGSRGIRGKQLRPIATQAAMAINLFTEISGLDYPYGELNLVNDPAPALYGQAPSSLIYLGSFVFRGEGTMAGGQGGFGFGGGSGSTRTAKFLKSVTAHEVGHQWWGSRISNANQRNYWFVESLAEFFSAVYLEQAFGPGEYQDQLDEWRFNILNTRMKASVQNASSLYAGEDDFRSYQSAVYSKGPYAFHMLRETFGEEKFWPFLKKFSQELASKREIVTLDIQRAAEKALGGVDEQGEYSVDLGWFFDQWIRGTGVPQYKFDYEVRETEDRQYIIEGTINQRVIVGSNREFDVLEGKYYRGVVDITVKTKDNDYQRRVIVEGAETPFRVKVPAKPVEVALNENGEILAHDTLVNQSWN